MKSYYLEGLGDPSLVRGELAKLLPGQADPWLLLASDEDVLAYFNVIAEADGSRIEADISGRHYNRDQAVLEVLRGLQKQLGGVVRDDDDNEL